MQRLEVGDVRIYFILFNVPDVVERFANGRVCGSVLGKWAIEPRMIFREDVLRRN